MANHKEFLSMATQTGKDTIYIDIDDEITTVIEKVRSSNEIHVPAAVSPAGT